jgi:hypothetical protein
MEITFSEEIEGSQMGVALTADNGASPCYLTELSDDISDISTLVCNYSKKPTRSRKTRERMVNSLIGMLTDANNQLPIYIEDLKQAKCIEPFEVSSKQGDDDKHFLFWFFIEKLCEEVRDEDTYPILKRLITQFNSLLAEAEIAKLSCDPVVFKEFFFRKKKDYYDENVVIRFNRKLLRNQPITLGKLKKMELEAVIKALNQGIFDFADTPSMQDVNKVSTELETDFLPCNFMLTDEFLTRYAKFRQFAEKRGPMLVFNYERYGMYVVDNFNQFNKDQIRAIYELDVKLYLIHKEMVKLNKELENVLKGKVNGKAVSYLQESGEEMFHFIHPSLDDEEGWKIHNEVKRLVRRQSVPDICQYLGKLASEDKILLPLMPSAAYTELVRMGMSDGEGYGEKYFKKHYHLLFV